MTDSTALSSQMQIYYDRLFIDTESERLVYDQGGQKRPLPKGMGKDVKFNRYTRLARATTALTEGTNPTAVDLTSTSVSATVAEYGNWTKISKFVSLTAIDREIKEAVKLMAQNGAETIDRLIREAMYSGASTILGGSKSALTDIAASNTLSAAEVRKAFRTLKKNFAKPFSDGFYMGIVGPDAAYDITGDTTWTNAKTYSDVKGLYKGEIGELYGIRFIETLDGKTESSTVTVHSNFIFGENAYGLTELEGDEMNVYVKKPGPNSTDNPLNRFSTCGWAQSFVAKVLVQGWILNVKTGVTA